MAKSDFPETFRRESTSEVTSPTCADEETEAIGGERTPTRSFKQVAPASGRVQIFQQLLVSPWPCVGHISQLLIISHCVNHFSFRHPLLCN